MKQFKTAPFFVNGARVWRTYLGGKLLDQSSNVVKYTDSHFPEEWMFSTINAINSCHGTPNEGLCVLRDESSITLKGLMESCAAEMLGTSHFERYKHSLGVLIKLIDSAERLTIQVHPNKEKAKILFNSEFGKTECWHILATRNELENPACIYLGFKKGISKKKWIKAFEKQDIPAMLSMLHRFNVKADETYLVHGGVPHAIGEGCLLIEFQEPTDYTIRVEKTTPSGLSVADTMCHQGLGFDTMFDCFDFNGKTKRETALNYRLTPRKTASSLQLVSYEDTPCFSVEKINVQYTPLRLEAQQSYYLLYIVKGSGEMEHKWGTNEIKKGDQIFVAASTKPFTINALTKDLTILLCKGPQV